MSRSSSSQRSRSRSISANSSAIKTRRSRRVFEIQRDVAAAGDCEDDDSSSTVQTGIARYRLAAQIGEGAFGRTYLACKLSSKGPSGTSIIPRQVVVKAMKLPDKDDGLGGVYDLRRRSLASMDIVRSIAHADTCRHPFIAKLLDWRFALQPDEAPLEVYEYCQAGDALGLLEHVGAADEPHKEAVNLQAHVLYLGVQVAEAISYLHESGFIHFDLKLDNVFIDALGDAKLGDFGLARPCRLGSRLMNPYSYWRSCRDARSFTAIRWLPPEQLAEPPVTVVDHAVDWFSLGALLFHLTFRRLPFEEHRSRALADDPATKDNVEQDMDDNGASDDSDEVRKKRRFLRLWRAEPRPRVDDRPKLNQRFKNLLYNLVAHDPGRRLGGGGDGCDAVFQHLHRLCGALELGWFDSAAPDDVDRMRRLVRSRALSRPYRLRLVQLRPP